MRIRLYPATASRVRLTVGGRRIDGSAAAGGGPAHLIEGLANGGLDVVIGEAPLAVGVAAEVKSDGDPLVGLLDDVTHAAERIARVSVSTGMQTPGPLRGATSPNPHGGVSVMEVGYRDTSRMPELCIGWRFEGVRPPDRAVSGGLYARGKLCNA